MKALVGTFNQEKALEGAFSVITNLRMDLRFKLWQLDTARQRCGSPGTRSGTCHSSLPSPGPGNPAVQGQGAEPPGQHTGQVMAFILRFKGLEIYHWSHLKVLRCCCVGKLSIDWKVHIRGVVRVFRVASCNNHTFNYFYLSLSF